MRLALVLVLFVASVTSSHATALSKQTPVQVNGRELVVHSSSVPVIVHRVFPPYWGKHVSQRQLKAGRLPPGAKR